MAGSTVTWRRLGAALATLVCVFVAAPLLIVVAVSVNDALYTFFPPRGFSLRWYGEVLGEPAWRDAIVTSLKLGGATSIACTAIGLGAALALHRGTFRGRNVLAGAFLSPIVFPGVLLGIALLYGVGALGLRSSFVTLFLGHVLISLPYAVRLILGALPSIPREVEEAAATLGAGEVQVLRTVTLPLIRPALAAAALFAFLASFDNVVISIFLSSTETVTLPVRIFSHIEFSTDASVAAVSTLFIGLTLAITTGMYAYGQIGRAHV